MGVPLRRKKSNLWDDEEQVVCKPFLFANKVRTAAKMSRRYNISGLPHDDDREIAHDVSKIEGSQSWCSVF